MLVMKKDRVLLVVCCFFYHKFYFQSKIISDTDKNPCTIDVCENKQCKRMSAEKGGQCDDLVNTPFSLCSFF